MLRHEEQKELLAAHALGALDAPEMARVEEHLETCAECRAELEEWRETAAALAYTVKAAEPSTDLRSRILENVRATDKPSTSKESVKGDGAAPASNVVRMSEASRFVRRSIAVYGAIAASLVIVALAASLFITWQRLQETRNALARYEQTVSSLAREVAQERAARELVTSPTSHSAQLSGTNMAPSASAQLAFDRRTGRAKLFAYNLPAAPAGKAYQLWFISNGKVMPGRVFTPDSAGSAVMDEQVPVESLGSAPIFAVTLEPAGGVQIPTGEKYLLSASS